jgi:hypothetical protein
MFDILMTKLDMSNKFYILGRASGIVEDVNRGGRSQATNVGSIPIARSTFFSKESSVSCGIPIRSSATYRLPQTQIQFGNPQWDLVRIPRGIGGDFAVSCHRSRARRFNQQRGYYAFVSIQEIFTWIHLWNTRLTRHIL